jgi:hypothetical protein
MKTNASFIIICKQNYFDQIRPADLESKQKPGYKKLVEIAQEYFSNNEYEAFADYFQEGQYFIELWAAHLMLEYGNPGPKLTSYALEVIKKYSHSPVSPDVASQETRWLEANFTKYR